MRATLARVARLGLAASLALLVARPALSQGLPPPVDIPISNIAQQTQVWCWAAVAQQIILHAVGPQRTPQQCALVAIANNAPPLTCCGAANPACVRTGSLPQIQALISYFGGRYSTQAPPTDPMTLYRTLASGRPIILQVGSGMMMSHVVVLRGMSFVPTPRGVMPVLHINDPLSYFTQPVLFQQLLPMWISAIVVEPGWPSPVLSSSPAVNVVGARSRPDPAPVSRVDPSEAASCRSDCRDDHDSCVDSIESVADCLDRRIDRCIDACTDRYDYPYSACRDRFCNPDVGSNVSWMPVCERARDRETRSCDRALDRCLRRCDSPRS